jgi:two-component system, OmpR family, phosphate regulon sensor histidine kinase PhoR
VALALWAGATITGALMAVAAGAAAFALLPRSVSTTASADTDETDATDLPALGDLLNAVGTPLLLVRERVVVFANQAARDVLGDHVEASDVRLAIRHPAAAERLAQIERGGVEDGETELVGLGSVESHWVMTANRVGQYLLVRLTDRSGERAVEQMRADFVANASHELRTPLATLLGFLETLEDDQAAGDPKTRQRFLKIMFDEATRMRNLVDDLMSLSRIEADRFTVPRDPVDLLPVIETVRDGCKTLSESRQSEILVENEATSTVVPGDRAQLAQLLSNLVTNALKYGRSGTAVRIKLEDAGSSLLRVRVIDRGEGIAPEHIPRLTERFYRVDPGRSRSVGGTGLGLAIAKHIAIRHRGRLEIVSKPGEGTSVRVYLQRAAPPETVTETSSS